MSSSVRMPPAASGKFSSQSFLPSQFFKNEGSLFAKPLLASHFVNPHPKTHSVTVSTPSEGKLWHTPFSAAFAGGVVAFTGFPAEGLKKRWQTGQPVTLQSFYPANLYRGALSFGMSVTLATTMSMSVKRILQNGLPGYNPESALWTGSVAVSCGILGSLVGSTPVENIIYRQQIAKCGPIFAIRSLIMQAGPSRLWTGLPQLALREGIFTGMMFKGGPAVRSFVLEKTDSSTLANLSEVFSAVVGATFSQPFDVVASQRQKSDGVGAFLEKTTLRGEALLQGIKENSVTITSAKEVAKQLYRTRGLPGFFLGLPGRALLFIWCAPLIPRVEKVASDALNRIDPVTVVKE